MGNFLFTVLLCFAFCNLSAQPGDCDCQGDTAKDTELADKLTCLVLPAAELIIPDNELFARWRYGKIYLNNGETISGELIHYDGLDDRLMIDSKNAATRLSVDKYTIGGFDLESLNSDEIYRFLRVKVNPKAEDVFLQLLVPGKNTLYAQRKLVRTLELKKITRLYTYYIRKEDGSMVSFSKPSRHTLFKLFPEKSDLYRSSLKKQHIRIRDESQLIHSIELFNTL